MVPGQALRVAWVRYRKGGFQIILWSHGSP